MIIEKPSFEILTKISDGGIEELKHIEKIGRVCYRSEGKITDDGESAKKFVKMLINHGHEAMIEHSTLSVMFRVDRGVSHEMVRHRIASFAQESTRYCNYSGEKFDNQIHCIVPTDLENSEQYAVWVSAMQFAEECYMELLKSGITPQIARSVLPNSLATTITITANYREWRNIFKLRCDEHAHPQIREVMIPLLAELKKKIPVVFEDL